MPLSLALSRKRERGLSGVRGFGLSSPLSRLRERGRGRGALDLLLIWLLILICPPLGRRPSGVVVEGVERHGCRERQRRARDGPFCRPLERRRNEGTRSAAQGRGRGEPFWFLFWRLKKETRA